MSSTIADSEFDEELTSSSFSYSWTSKDTNEEAIDLVRRGKEICALIPGDKHIPLRGHLLTRLFVGESQEYSTSFVTRVKNYFRWKSHYQQLGSERGFMIRFGPWEKAPFRSSQDDAWYFSKLTSNTVESKPYSRACWHQEYLWNASEYKYYVRGFWASKRFEHPLLVVDTALKLMEQRTLKVTPPKEYCLFMSLPEVPPYQGFTSADNRFRLTFLQVFYKNAEGVHFQKGSWQLTYNIDLPELWESIGPEGHLFNGIDHEPSMEAVQTAVVEESEEDWF